ncbi:AtzH-like domain-containing protein [Herbiconiux sp.]|uniref:AtzH-like domain-containing protein n=1 Tax=Herbiconiux sp. TaxID=1871186 RepID=UPI0025C47313|nr:AtzH-like domain-containing protein [Herbiconiux sp.]
MPEHAIPAGVTTIDGALEPAALDELLSAFRAYESALMSNDLEVLDRSFAPGPSTLRGDAAGLLVGHDRISAFRGLRGGLPPRVITEVHLRVIGPEAVLIVSVSAPVKGGSGLQTQLWERRDGAWVISAAHVHGAPPAINGSVWRVAGVPLVPALPMSTAGAGEDSDGAEPRALEGMTVAVKDLYAVAGFAIGAGIPQYLAEAPVQTQDAAAVAALRAGGAALQGIAQTDEFAYSIAGRNVHYGTPPNAAVPGAISGGSSSGPAAAVALGQATIGLATDTAGSIRVPASYNGLWGLRTSHGAVSADGLLPLAPSFDSIGWLTRSAAALRAAAEASFAGAPGATAVAGVASATDARSGVSADVGASAGSGSGARAGSGASAGAGSGEGAGVATGAGSGMRAGSGASAGSGDTRDEASGGPGAVLDARYVVDPALLQGCDAAVSAAFTGLVEGPRSLELFGAIELVDLGDLDAVFAAFRTVQAAEAWREHGSWITTHPGVLGPDIAERFDVASSVDADAEAAGRAHLAEARARLDSVLGGRILLLPSASSAAPALNAPAESIADVRAATLRMTSVAGTGGYPAVSAPVLSVPAPGGRAPLGLCLVGPRGSDLALIDVAARLAEALRS